MLADGCVSRGWVSLGGQLLESWLISYEEAKWGQFGTRC
ncbi:hypothetical protein I3843_11G000300 [Carya illinoinensis]|uniref:Uncharacterized protein n=1 Tax=Carya illinoinensis TaxID=32201 RepID=A0A8T1NZN7_CARIL|nr:hypothetical protein CIPAW_11G000400 [Carya illinoinensis]KAG7954095.1 hypothetical protein I3843_11G000300 [Carya illinoinensis]